MRYLNNMLKKQNKQDNYNFGKTSLTQNYNKGFINGYNNVNIKDDKRESIESDIQKQKVMNFKKYNRLINPALNLSTNNKNNENIKLIIVGNGDKKYKKHLIKLIKKLKLKNQIIFKENLNNHERNKLMQKALAIIVTSVREGWGLIVTEANANGTIAITYNTDGLRDANTNETGIIAKDNSPRELAKLMKLIINNPDIRKEKEIQALRFASKHGDWEGNADKLEEWLKIK